jgi:50S ribosomal protein L16 3-hydroxylase
VGPHSDLYDVFLLQGSGRRRWQIDVGGDLRTVDADVRVLSNFKPTHEWVLEPGDMLYLPPNVGHFGVSLDDNCMTWSVGFTNPSHEQLVHNYLAYLGMEAKPTGMLQDPDLQLQNHPAELSDATVARVLQALQDVRLDDERVATFTGRLLTGRSHVTLPKPKPPISRSAFSALLSASTTMALSPPCRMLFRGSRIFVHGDVHDVPASSVALFQTLANERRVSLSAHKTTDATVVLLHRLYNDGIAKIS